MRYDGVGGMSFIAWAARQSKPHAYLIAEDIVADPAAVVRDTEIDASWHWQFTKVLRAQLREGEYQGNQYGDLDALVRVLTRSPATATRITPSRSTTWRATTRSGSSSKS